MKAMLKETFLKLMGAYTQDTAYAENCWQELEMAYTQSSRYYHNLKHLLHMIQGLEEMEDSVSNHDCLLFAIFYHDAVYNVKRQDNEVKSADLMENHLRKTSFDDIPVCRQLIEATKLHESANDDMRILMDLDLAILGQEAEVYETYSKNIRKEYKMYPGFMYRKGRKKVLQHFLEKDQIFMTDHYLENYEQQARENLNRELQSLS
ncbi:hypothetical protein POV27_01650 [Aureisphaera galaxeae]|uniref:HD domain-containing protein n=1 Tax=Aureisphaera galaxeae TaxID=1538023 RepID=UPI0023505BDF|nr:hypothetical protein [Aureisphaera galaxeae]MDC8002744.1 hypothetical protein [Aureisphaera galaxeae]